MNYIEIPLVGRYKLHTKRDEHNAERVCALIEQSPGAFERDDSFGHVTASGFVLNTARDSLLLTHHAKWDCWLPVGGHCDGIRDPFFIAQKEAYEEAGLSRITAISTDVFDIDIHAVPEWNGQRSHLHFDIRFLFGAAESDIVRISEESKELQWVPFDQIEKYNSQYSVAVFLEKLRLQ